MQQITVNQAHVDKAFTGVVYCDIGRLNYGAMVDGKWLKRKDGKVR